MSENIVFKYDPQKINEMQEISFNGSIEALESDPQHQEVHVHPLLPLSAHCSAIMGKFCLKISFLCIPYIYCIHDIFPTHEPFLSSIWANLIRADADPKGAIENT